MNDAVELGDGLASVAAEARAKFRPAAPSAMPHDFRISLDALRRGGTDRYLAAAPIHAARQPMPGFDPDYVNIVDYILRITHRIWEEKDIGYIYDTYAADCMIWDDFGLSYGRDKVVADTVAMNNAFPDLRIVADEVIWAGDAASGFHTSHRTQIFGHNTGFSRFGAPTGRRTQFWCVANCVARDNEIYHEHVVYDTTALVTQLGLDPVALARRLAPARPDDLLPPDFLASEPIRLLGQNKPAATPIPRDFADGPEAFARAALHSVWNRRNFAAMAEVYAPSVVSHATAGRVFNGVGELRSFVISLVAMFPDLGFAIDDLYWMGDPEQGFLLAMRWRISGTHRGFGRYGEPTGRPVHLWGITHWVIERGAVTREWMLFNEFGVLMQVHGGR